MFSWSINFVKEGMCIYPLTLTRTLTNGHGNGNPFSSIHLLLLHSLNSNNNNNYPRRRRTWRISQTLNPTPHLTMTTIHSPSNRRRPTCPSCAKPSTFCLCVRIQNPNLPNSIAVTILQHSLEKKHPLNSARIATLGLQNVLLASVSDVNIDARFSIRLMFPTEFHESSFYFTIAKHGEMKSPPPEIMMLPHDALSKGFVVKKFDNAGCEEFEIKVPAGSMLLFPSERAVGIQEMRKSDDDDHHKQVEVKNLIVLDGTWAKAKRMYKENPWLNLLPHLKLEMEMMSLYSEVRTQPRDGCLSTIESIVYALKGLGDETDGLDQLLQVFGSMVEDQRRCKNQRIITGTSN